MVERCLQTLTLLDPAPKEVIVVVGDEYQGELPQDAHGLRMRTIHRGTGEFHFSRAINCGLLVSQGELVLMLNDDIEAESSDWLGKMAVHLNDPTVGAVGAILLYPDRSIQHIGIELEEGEPIHVLKGCQLFEATTAASQARDVAGVTGACLLARRYDLMGIGGMSLDFPLSYGDVDLCFRLLRSGARVVLEPSAILVHHESASRKPVIELWEQKRFIRRWGNSQLLSKSNPNRRYDFPMMPDLLDGDNLEELRHEVLRLRDQAIGTEARSEYFSGHVENLNERIVELKKQVTERDVLIEEWKDRVVERDTRIAERDIRIAERDTRIATLSDKIAQQQNTIAEKDLQISDAIENISRLQDYLARPLIVRIVRRIKRVNKDS